jgi:hypothetical protein
MNLFRLFHSLGMTALLLVMALPASAADSKSSDEWQFGAEVYLWGASLDATPTGGDTIHISFSDIMDDLNMALMTTLAARKGKWTLFTDIIYMDLEDEIKGTAELIHRPVSVDVDVEMESWIVTAAGAYTVMETDKHSLALLAGGRYLALEIPLKFQIGPVKLKPSPQPHGHNLDGIIGLRGKVDLADKWYLTYYADAGSGDSESTWQALAGLNYRFKKVDATFGYRYLDWEFDSSDALEEITVKGPFAGVKFAF